MKRKDDDLLTTVSRIAMKTYSRRGLLGWVGKSGLALTAVAAGLGAAVPALACIPGASCLGACNCTASTCSWRPDFPACTVTCNTNCYVCGCGCFRAHGYNSDTCAPICEYIFCNSGDCSC